MPSAKLHRLFQRRPLQLPSPLARHDVRLDQSLLAVTKAAARIHFQPLSAFLDQVTDRRGGFISPQRVSEALHVPLAKIARLAKVHRNTLAQHPDSPVVQERLGDIARIITTATELLGGEQGRAIVWFKHQPLWRVSMDKQRRSWSRAATATPFSPISTSCARASTRDGKARADDCGHPPLLANARAEMGP
jgi:hypothetical protein